MKQTSNLTFIRPGDDALWVAPDGIHIGARLIGRGGRGPATGSETPDRIEAMLAIAFRKRLPPYVIDSIYVAADIARRGDLALANIRLAVGGLARIKAADDLARRLDMADELFTKGVTPTELLGALDMGPPPDLSRYNRFQPRVPSGNGEYSGRFGSDVGPGDSKANGPSVLPKVALVVAPGSSLLSPGLGAATLASLSALAAFVGAAAVLGVAFVPWSKSDSTDAPIPGDPNNSYSFDGAAGTLKVKDKQGTVLAAGVRDKTGIFYDAITGIPFARQVGSSIMFDTTSSVIPDRGAKEAPKEENGSAAGTDEPKLCPEPTEEKDNKPSDSARKYQEQISAMINPQRPLRYGLAMAYFNPITGKWVNLDECDERTGTMIEAKGPNYANVISFPAGAKNVTDTFLDQATRQVQASQGRRIEWYFAEQKAADFAADLFRRTSFLKEKINIIVRPANQT